MKSDTLLHWMTHVGEGSWGQFRSAIAKLAGPDADVAAIARTMRTSLSDLGDADFFVDGSQRWRIRPTVLGGLSLRPGAAVLVGGRTPDVIHALRNAAESHACRLTTQVDKAVPARVMVEGDRNVLLAVAATAGISFVDDLSLTVVANAVPIEVQVANAEVDRPPANWAARSFDFALMRWVDGLQERSACEYRSQYGPHRFYLHLRRGRFLRLPKRDAVFAAAALAGVPLIGYDGNSKTLSCSLATPLPELCARAACLCSGAPAEVREDRLLYKAVSAELARVLLVASGQSHAGRHLAGAIAK